jgi:hypothetical protein
MDALHARGELRVIGQRGADAARHGVALRSPPMRQAARVLAGDPLRVARPGRDLAVEGHRRLEEHPGQSGAGVLAERLVEQPRPGGELAVGDRDVDALVAQDARPPAGGLLRRIVGGDDDAGDARLQDRVRARRGLSLVTARLQRHVHRRAVRVAVAAGHQRLALGVTAAVDRVEALPQHLAVRDHHGAHHRVGRRTTAAPLRELDGAGEVQMIGLEERRHCA